LTQTNNYFALLPFTKTTDHVDAKVDYQADEKDRYAVRFSWETTPGRFGSMGRSVWSGPNQFRLDAGLSRRIQVNERWALQLRADSYNVGNTSFFSNPNTDLNSANFGYVTGTNGSGSGVNGFASARSVQFAMKIMF